MIERIAEKVSVITVHSLDREKSRDGTRVMPYKLRWQGRDYIITKLGFHHTVRLGRKLIHKFSVSTGTIDFRLSYDTETLEWVLEEVSDGLAA